jgi:hypothetical protein
MYVYILIGEILICVLKKWSFACICISHANILFKPDKMRRYLIRAFAGLFMEQVGNYPLR